MKTLRSAALVLLALALIGALVWSFLPKPPPVDVGSVTRGALVVTADGDGRTRVKDRFVIAAPVSGDLQRLELHPGDRVKPGAALAALTPGAPPLLDTRSRAQAEAQVKLAVAGRSQADARVRLAEAAADFARTEHGRTQALFDQGGLAKAELDGAELKKRTAEAELASARFGARVAEFQVETARAAMRSSKPGAPDAGTVDIRSPIDATVLRVLQESGGPVLAGAPLLEIGDPSALEVVVELLSSDAVAVRPDAEVTIDQWGGDRPLSARVRAVEPSAFTKLSALGLEEQRVNVIADLTAAREEYRALGDAYRVHARIVVWQRADATRVPVSALFREGGGWAVLVVAGDVARLRPVDIGRRSAREAEVVSGLAEGERIVLHPSDKLTDGVRVLPSPR